MIDAYASRGHYAAHLLPVWRALPDEVRGSWHRHPPRVDGPPVLVASGPDAISCRGRRLVYLEHGAGQSYDGAGALAVVGYSGSPGLERCLLFLCPSETVADRWRARYDVPAVAIGCPRLDRWHTRGTAIHVNDPGGEGARVIPPGPTVAVTFHWPCGVAPEARWAFPHYRRHLHALCCAVRASGGSVVGTAHPRAWDALRSEWRRHGATPVQDIDEVLAVADLLIGDNSSVLYEAAAVGVRTLALNAPWYRRDVEHGLRFWSHPPGPMVDSGAELLERWAVADTPAEVAQRAAAVAHAYAAVDGQASARAVAAILGVLDG